MECTDIAAGEHGDPLPDAETIVATAEEICLRAIWFGWVPELGDPVTFRSFIADREEFYGWADYLDLIHRPMTSATIDEEAAIDFADAGFIEDWNGQAMFIPECWMYDFGHEPWCTACDQSRPADPERLALAGRP
jgi:hypothetical protein